MKEKSIIILIIVIFAITGCSFGTKEKILKKIEIKSAKCKIIEEKDTHSGFLGDGDYFAKIKCTNLNNKNISKHWKKLPLSEELNKVAEMKQCNGKGCKNIYERHSIPNVTRGYYYFLDRHSDSKDKYDDKDLNNRSSLNFTLAIMDTDSEIIYYYEMDT